jgi:predicted transcriptional regulator
MDDKNATISLAAGVVAAYVGSNTVTVSDLPGLIRAVHDALAGVGAPVAAPSEPAAKATAAQIRKSITADALISFIDGKPYKTLKRHLTTQGWTVEEYKTRYGLPPDYPTTAPAYSQARSAMAKALGLGQGGRKGKSLAPAPKGRAKKA